MTGILAIAQMRQNVAQSEQHIARQEAVIDRLSAQGHIAAAAEARSLLVTMHEHLRIERTMLAQLEDGTEA